MLCGSTTGSVSSGRGSAPPPGRRVSDISRRGIFRICSWAWFASPIGAGLAVVVVVVLVLRLLLLLLQCQLPLFRRSVGFGGCWSWQLLCWPVVVVVTVVVWCVLMLLLLLLWLVCLWPWTCCFGWFCLGSLLVYV